MIAVKTKRSTAANFSKTMCQWDIGFVFKSSMVPVLYSSAKLFMVIAGMRNKKIQGAKEKKAFKSAKPAFNMLKSFLKIHKNKPFSNKNTPITKYAIGLAKNELNSFFKMANISIILTVYFFLEGFFIFYRVISSTF
jgi:hypothetical protein